MKTAVFVSLLFLASCATPPPPATGGGLVMDGLQAAATQTTIAATQQAAPIETAAAIATAATMADNATRQAAIIATQTAAPIETQQAQAIEVTRQAQATAASHADSMESIAIASFATREAGNTIATRAVQNLEVGAKAKNARRWEWVKDVGAGSVLVLFFGLGAGGVAILFRNALTLRDEDGTVIAFGKHNFLPSESPMIIEQQPQQLPRLVPFAPRGGEHAPMETIRPSYILRANGSRIDTFKFTGRALDRLETYIKTSKDIGFRREKSGNGLGLNELIGVSSATTYHDIKEAMKGQGWIIADGAGHVWSDEGLKEVLKMRPLPQENDEAE